MGENDAFAHVKARGVISAEKLEDVTWKGGGGDRNHAWGGEGDYIIGGKKNGGLRYSPAFQTPVSERGLVGEYPAAGGGE